MKIKNDERSPFPLVWCLATTTTASSFGIPTAKLRKKKRLRINYKQRMHLTIDGSVGIFSVRFGIRYVKIRFGIVEILWKRYRRFGSVRYFGTLYRPNYSVRFGIFRLGIFSVWYSSVRFVFTEPKIARYTELFGSVWQYRTHLY